MARNARQAAAAPIAEAAKYFPDLNATQVNAMGLSPQDAALARLIHRTTLQRWVTLQWILNQLLTQPLNRIEPKLQAVLLTGAAQAMFIDGVPDYAVVDASVELAKKWVRPKSAGLVNAVLRRLVKVVGERHLGPWEPAADRVPLPDAVDPVGKGGWLALNQKLLPPTKDKIRHLSVATGMPQAVVDKWWQLHGPRACRDLCLQAMQTVPVIVSGPGIQEVLACSDVDLVSADEAKKQPVWRKHAVDGFAVFEGVHADLVTWLGEDETRRVQDPTAAGAVGLIEQWAAKRCDQNAKIADVLDACAGRGTKTRQLLDVFEQAVVSAYDPAKDRVKDLAKLAKQNKRMHVLETDKFAPKQFDLIVLDVPCSNSGVLARRPEARFRFGQKSLQQLLDLQKQIIDNALPALKPGGAVLYATCSIEPEENQKQAAEIVQKTGGQILAERMKLPNRCADPTEHQDGGYAVLIEAQVE